MERDSASVASQEIMSLKKNQKKLPQNRLKISIYKKDNDDKKIGV